MIKWNLLFTYRELLWVQVQTLQERKEQLAWTGVVAPRPSEDHRHPQPGHVTDDLIAHVIESPIKENNRISPPGRSILVQSSSKLSEIGLHYRNICVHLSQTDIHISLSVHRGNHRDSRVNLLLLQ